MFSMSSDRLPTTIGVTKTIYAMPCSPLHFSVHRLIDLWADPVSLECVPFPDMHQPDLGPVSLLMPLSYKLILTLYTSKS